MKVLYTLSIGISNASREEVFDIPNDLGITEEEWDEYSEIEKEETIWDDYRYWADMFTDGGWEILDE